MMEREKLSGTLMIRPGIAEEQLGTKVLHVRAGLQGRGRGALQPRRRQPRARLGQRGNGMVSVEHNLPGETAHSAGAPWRGRSASTRSS
ncbi:MAG: hypothetical protein R2712_13265 [Vicinamibacterales bacterium]